MIDAPVLEHALLPVRPEDAEEFATAFAAARRHVEAVPGFRGLHLSRCLERADTWLLLIGWDSVEAHTEGFRGSAGYDRWRALLHRFYEPFPVVEHFLPALTTPDPATARPAGP